MTGKTAQILIEEKGRYLWGVLLSAKATELVSATTWISHQNIPPVNTPAHENIQTGQFHQEAQ